MIDRHRPASNITPAEAHRKAVEAGPLSPLERMHFAAQLRQKRAQDEYERAEAAWRAQLALELAP